MLCRENLLNRRAELFDLKFFIRKTFNLVVNPARQDRRHSRSIDLVGLGEGGPFLFSLPDRAPCPPTFSMEGLEQATDPHFPH